MGMVNRISLAALAFGAVLIGQFHSSAQAQETFPIGEVKRLLVGNTMTYHAPNGADLKVYIAPGGAVEMVSSQSTNQVISKRWWIGQGAFCRTIGMQNRNHCTHVGQGSQPDTYAFYAKNGQKLYEAKVMPGRQLGDGASETATAATEPGSGPRTEPGPASGASSRSPEQIVAHLDRDHDGRLTLSEFRREQKIFDRIDTDGDGYLTVQELAKRNEIESDEPAESVPPEQDTEEMVSSLEQAKAVTSRFEKEPVNSSATTIKDITAILDQQEIADKPEIDKLVALANSNPPSGATKRELTKYYADRTLARLDIGMVNEALEDSREAYTLMNESEYVGRTLTERIRNVRANLERTSGNFQEAIRLYKEFLDKQPSVSMWAGLAKTYFVSGDFDAAAETVRHFDKLVERIRANPRSTPIQRARVDLSSAALRVVRFESSGRWARAEPYLRKTIEAERAFRKLMPTRPVRLEFLEQGELAKNLMHQGRRVEAEILARGALLKNLKQFGKMNLTTAVIAGDLALILRSEGRYEDSIALRQASIKILTAIGERSTSGRLAASRLGLANALVSLGQWNDALKNFEIVRKDLAANPTLFTRLMATGIFIPIALIETNRAQEAIDLLKPIYEKEIDRLGPNHYAAAEKGGALGMAYASLGDQRTALQYFKTAVPVLLSRSGPSDEETSDRAGNVQRERLIFESYLSVLEKIRGTPLEKELGIDAVSEAFVIADVARSHAVQSALSASSVRGAVGNPELADLARREQDAQKQRTALLSVLANVLSSPTQQQDAKAVAALKTQIKKLKQAQTLLRSEIESRFPAYAELVNPKPPTIAKIQQLLSPEEALVATYVADDRTYVWAVAKSGPPAFAAVPLGRDRIAAVVKDLRRALDPGVRTINELPAFDVNLANRFYRLLFGKVEKTIAAAHAWNVIAHGPLGQLPFSVLVTEPQKSAPTNGVPFEDYKKVAWLARSRSITVLPSVAALESLRAGTHKDHPQRDFIGFGDPFFNAVQAKKAQEIEVARDNSAAGTRADTGAVPIALRSAPRVAGGESANIGMLPRLPDTREEIQSIAHVFNVDAGRDLYFGEHANESNVKHAELSRYRIVDFATHGLVPGDLEGLTQPALALSPPEVTGSSDEDGLLTLSEILGLRMDAEWVVLSACNTGAADGAGAEAFTGLGRAFFYAGTRAVLLSNWPIETKSARILTTTLFRLRAENPKLRRAEALRQAMLALIDGKGATDPKTGAVLFSYAHPIFWAPFSLVGDGGV